MVARVAGGRMVSPLAPCFPRREKRLVEKTRPAARDGKVTQPRASTYRFTAFRLVSPEGQFYVSPNNKGLSPPARGNRRRRPARRRLRRACLRSRSTATYGANTSSSSRRRSAPGGTGCSN